MSAATEVTRHKNSRIGIRLTPRQDALIRDAAAASGQSLTDFVTTAAVSRAQDELADRRVFRLDPAQWSEFTAMLDRPARTIPELAEFLSTPAPWDRQPAK